MRYALAMAMALGLTLSFAAPETAAAGSRKSVSQKHAAKKARAHKRRRARRGSPQVRGFRTSVGGYSYTVQDSYRYDPHVPPPEDFGPYLDVTPSPNGILPTGSYID